MNNNNTYMELKMFVDCDDAILLEKYKVCAKEHNERASKPNAFLDAGFDLFTPKMGNQAFMAGQQLKLDTKVVCAAKIVNKQENLAYNTGYYMYPRSSIYKTNIRLANSVGIIDSGYRGHLIGMFDVLSGGFVADDEYNRYLQICAPNLMPIFVIVVDTIEQLGETTERGQGGFGSTGN